MQKRVPQVCKLPPHRGAVNDVSFDASGSYVATASEDGTVAVRAPRAPLRVARVARPPHAQVGVPLFSPR
jgi:WD40 repeat protein